MHKLFDGLCHVESIKTKKSTDIPMSLPVQVMANICKVILKLGTHVLKVDQFNRNQLTFGTCVLFSVEQKPVQPLPSVERSCWRTNIRSGLAANGQNLFFFFFLYILHKTCLQKIVFISNHYMYFNGLSYPLSNKRTCRHPQQNLGKGSVYRPSQNICGWHYYFTILAYSSVSFVSGLVNVSWYN